jgi:hypothetical protein
LEKEGNNSSQSSQEVRYQSDGAIELPSPIKEKRRAIRKIDWDRCKRKLCRIQSYKMDHYSKIYSGSAGIATSSLFSYLVIYESTEINAHVISFFLLLTIFSSAFSVIFYLLDRENLKQRADDIAEILTDMAEIESTFIDET